MKIKMKDKPEEKSETATDEDLTINRKKYPQMKILKIINMKLMK